MSFRFAYVRGLWGNREGRAFGWGFVSQASSSATNLGLSIVCGRLLGPVGVGAIAFGIFAYIIALGLQHSLITEPLISMSAATSADQRGRSANLAATMTIILGCLASCVILGAGLIIPGIIGRGFLAMAPWLAPALLQDLWRILLFRDRRPAAAALNDMIWLVAMMTAVLFVVARATESAVVACWGLGALTGVIVGFKQMNVRLSSPMSAIRWWRRDALPFGKWIALSTVLSNVGVGIGAAVLSVVLGARALGGLQAASSVFTPLTFLVPAIALPGLPAVARGIAVDYRHGRLLGLKLSTLAAALTAGYSVVLVLGGWRLLPVLYGHQFLPFKDLFWPIAASQLLLSAGVGAGLILTAQQRGRAILLCRTLGTVTTSGCVTLLAVLDGLTGAAWGIAVGAVVSSAVTSWFGFREPARVSGGAIGTRASIEEVAVALGGESGPPFLGG